MVAHYEARLIVPTGPNLGGLLTPYAYDQRLEALENHLGAAFGGFTVTEGRGGWWDSGGAIMFHEQVRVYLLAFDSDALLACRAFNRLRATVKTQLEQRAVYLSRTTIAEEPVQ